MYFEKVEMNMNMENIYKKIGRNDSLMSENDHAFLCGLLEKYKPKNILEVGVYAGGTTIAILDCIQQMKLSDSKIYSIDLATTIKGNKKVGYMVDLAKPYLNNLDNYHLYTGVVIPEVIEEIAKEQKIDFAIIDTAHYLPGEILDFLACFPFLKKDAVVVLHDVMLNHKDKHRAAATKVVFDTVVGKKIWNWDMEKYPNIAAIQLNDDTEKYIIDLISALSLSWYYNPGKDILDEYGKIIQKYYPVESYDLYKTLIKMSEEWWLDSNRNVSAMIAQLIAVITHDPLKNFYIYGAGTLGKKYFKIIKQYNLENRISGFIISDDQEMKEKTIPGGGIVYKLSEIQCDDNTVILNLLSNKEVEDNLKGRGYNYVNIRLQGLTREMVHIHL